VNDISFFLDNICFDKETLCVVDKVMGDNTLNIGIICAFVRTHPYPSQEGKRRAAEPLKSPPGRGRGGLKIRNSPVHALTFLSHAI
jgi:hypothetical protein